MAWQTVDCSKCKNSYSVQMYGPHKTRDWKVANWNGICDNCKEAAKAVLVEQNKSGALPELTGSDKQIAWAMKIRQEFIDWGESVSKPEIEDIIEDCEYYHRIVADMGLVQAAMAFVLDKHSAHWWIESRNSINSIIIVDTVAEIVKSTTPDTVESKCKYRHVDKIPCLKKWGK